MLGKCVCLCKCELVCVFMQVHSPIFHHTCSDTLKPHARNSHALSPPPLSLSLSLSLYLARARSLSASHSHFLSQETKLVSRTSKPVYALCDASACRGLSIYVRVCVCVSVCVSVRACSLFNTSKTSALCPFDVVGQVHELSTESVLNRKRSL